MLHIHHIQLILRIIVSVLLLITLVCVAVGGEQCQEIKGHKKCIGSIGMELWKHKYLNFGGQYFVFIANILCKVIVLFLLIYGAAMRRLPRLASVGMCGICVFLLLICFGVEAYYSTYPSPGVKHGYVQSYIAATVLYIFAAIILGVDAGLTMLLHHEL